MNVWWKKSAGANGPGARRIKPGTWSTDQTWHLVDTLVEENGRPAVSEASEDGPRESKTGTDRDLTSLDGGEGAL